ncbi:MAG TPA: DsbA family protein [Allosphingosinicella sp.]|uniref:DsbA family protein n=1 Tax=Allosphingosinicella sp. TaxID=2823234 RepID=UPI002F28F7D4
MAISASRGLLAVAGATGILLGAAGMAFLAGPFGAERDQAKVEGIVRDYLLANPELVTEAQARLQERETAKLIEANRALIETPFGSAWAGAADGDVVLVELFDYACGYCRQSNADVERLLAEDKKLKVVWREWPVLGQDSLAAAEASLAAAEQGRFRPFFDQLFGQGRPTAPALQAARSKTGVEAAGAQPRYRAEIEKNYELARLIGATGTPTFIVGDKVLQGAVGYEALKEAIAQARRS